MILDVENITKYFGRTKAVSNLSFTVDKGQIVGLLGPNGSGKTTTMRMISSYYYPNSGKILVNDTDTQKFTAKTQLNIGYLPENNPLYLDMMVIDYLKMTIDILDSKKSDKEKFDKILEVSKQVSISNKLTTTLNELSKGYKQRVGIAAALVHDPMLLILDEPNEGLDHNERLKIRQLIKDLSVNKGIIISTHVMEEAKAMCNKVVVINNGALVTEGRPDEISKSKSIRIKLEGSNIKKELQYLSKEGVKVTFIDETSKIKEISIETEKEIQPTLSKLIAKNDWIIWEMIQADSLEEVFKKLD